MKANVVYIKPDKAERVNEILVAEKEFIENKKIETPNIETKP
jgi:hypothetical protein